MNKYTFHTVNGYTFFTDPGHGWLCVPLAELAGFEPSEYSYQDATYAYLEEDCDAPAWVDRIGGKRGASFWQRRSTVHTDGESFVRSLASFPGKDTA